MVTKTTTIRLEEEQLTTIKELNINLSEWVRERLQEEVLTLQDIDVRIQKNKKELEKLENMRYLVLQSNTDILDISSKTAQEIKFLQETKVLLKKNPTFLEGRINLYANQFGIINKPTKRQFMNLLNKIEVEKLPPKSI